MTTVKIVAGCRCAAGTRIDILIWRQRLRSAKRQAVANGSEAGTQRLACQSNRDLKAVGKTFRTFGPFQMTKANGFGWEEIFRP
jgi:hypothetical protein